MSERLTPETAAALAAELRAKGEAMVKEGEALIAESEVIEGYAQGLRRLQSRGTSGTVGTMETPAVPSMGAKVSRAKTATKTRTMFQRVLQARHVSLPEWARQQDPKLFLSVESAKSWVKRPGKGGRPVPREWADRIAKELKEPGLAIGKNWPNGIRD